MNRLAGQTAIACFCLCCFFTPTTVHSAPFLRTVALTGDPASGTTNGETYSFFSAPVLDGSGRTAFVGYLTGDGVDNTNNEGVWSEVFGSLELVARTGEHAPGTEPGVSFLRFGNPYVNPVLNTAGDLVFPAELVGDSVDSSNRGGLWSNKSGTPSLVVREGDHLPGTPPEIGLTDLLSPGGFQFYEDSIGHVGFSSYAGTSLDPFEFSGFWIEDSGIFKSVVVSGEQALGMPDGQKYYTSYGSLTATGPIGYGAYLAPYNPNGTTDNAYWVQNKDNFELLLSAGDHAPDQPSSATIVALGGVALNSNGQVAFRALISDHAINSNIDVGIWTGEPWAPRLVARTGQPHSDSTEETLFAEIGPFISFSLAGQVAFDGSRPNPNSDGEVDSGIWIDDGGTLALVVRQDGHPPGTPDGVVFSRFNTHIFNSSGQLMIDGRLSGEGVDDSNDRGLWVQDRTGALRLVVREGDLLEVVPGDNRTVAKINRPLLLSSHDRGGNTVYNDLGQLAFGAQFTDGSGGVFVSSLGTLPEPSSLLLLAVAGAISCCRRRTSWRSNESPRRTSE